jgi:hypothetical protein
MGTIGRRLNPGRRLNHEAKTRGVSMRHKILAGAIFAISLLVAASLSARLETPAAPPEDSQEVSKLLEDIKLQAGDLLRDSDELETFT